MGKGKKKDKKEEHKEDVPQIGGLSIGDDGATTSQASVPSATTSAAKAEPAPTVQEEEDAGEGLTGGGKKRRRKKKTVAETDEPKPPPQPKITPSHTSGPRGTTPPFQEAQFHPPSPRGAAPPAQPGPFQAPGPRGAAPPAQPGPFQAPGPRGAAPPAQPGPFQAPGPRGAAPPAQPGPFQAPSPKGGSGEPQKGPERPGRFEEKREMERAHIAKCKFQIPTKIIGKSVKARNTNVLVNYLPLNFTPIKVYRYDVGVKPERPKKMVPVAFNAFFSKKFPRVLVAYDQNKNFFSSKKLPGVTDKDRFGDNVVVKDNNGKEMTFEVSIKMTGEIDLNVIFQYMKGGTSLNPPTEAIQCIDIILRQGSLNGYIKAGHTYFRRPDNPLRLGEGLEMWTGLFQSAIFNTRAWINIDVAHKGFPTAQPVERLLEEFNLDPRQPLNRQRGFDKFCAMLKGLKIMAYIGGDRAVRREMICNEVVSPADKQMFEVTSPEGRQIRMSVADYFGKVKNIRLRAPHLNCLWVGPRDKSIFYPMEFCEVAYGQVLHKQLNDRQLATIVKEAATPPDIRKKKIESVVQAMEYSRNVYLKEFGLQVSDQFAQVQAKILFPPTILYQGSKAVPKNGVWWSALMYSGAQISRWTLIAVERDVRAVNGETLVKLFLDQSRQMGITMPPPLAPVYNLDLRGLPDKLAQAKKAGLDVVVVVVPTERGPRNVYSEIKKIAERQVGILTQCVREQTAQRMNPQTAKNLLLKINAKMRGVNHVLDVGSVPACLARGGVMVVGADVTHPSPDQQNIPSIAAVTASMDKACTIYALEMSIQTPKMEMIVQLEDIMVDHLRAHVARAGSLPRKIYVFRDGVSEGQFAMILNTELMAVYNAYRRLTGKDAKPEVLFLLVQKRHHTRMFVPNDRANVSPGTVVDTDIVHPRELDFYLVSHAAIKGTARPTRYYCVRNDGSLPHDEVEQLAYYLCHLYSRCSRAVSYPTPTYYAHLACLRARTLTLGEQFNNAKLEKEPQRLKILDNMHKDNPMFFV